MTDNLLEQIEQLIVEYKVAREFEKQALAERDELFKQQVMIEQDIYSCKCEFVKVSISKVQDNELLISIAADMKILKEKEKELKERYKKDGNKYSSAWPKTNKIRKKIHKLKDQYWIDMSMHILPFD